MGIMADDELGMDLSAVDPSRVVKGCADDMGVMIMALVVIAKRRGVAPFRRTGEKDTSFDSLRSRSEEMRSAASSMGRDDADRSGLDVSDQLDRSGRWYGLDIIDVIDEETDRDGGAALGEPLEPDITLSSPVLPSTSASTFASRDVFGQVAAKGDKGNKTTSGLFGHGKVSGDGMGRRQQGLYGEEGDWTVDRYDPDGAYETPMPRNGFNVPLVRSGSEADGHDDQRRGPAGARRREDSGKEKANRQQGAMRRDLRDALAFEKVANWREDSQTTATTSTIVTGSSGHRTVLQEMMDEFGLG